MAKHPAPFLIIIPALLIAFTAWGWSRPDRVEDEVANIWIPTSTSYYSDKEYASDVSSTYDDDAADTLTTLFAAMAVSRDGNNLFTEDRLKEVTSRMKDAERNTKVEYKGNTFTWDDLCASNNAGIGTTYEFPCVRIAPIDYFRESRWFFDEVDRVTWHDTAIHDKLVKPRAPRVGTMKSFCTSLDSATGLFNETHPGTCDHEYRMRTDVEYVIGKNLSVTNLNPLLLFADVGNFEENLPCKICIETAYDGTIQALTSAAVGTFTLLELNLMQLEAALQGTNATSELMQASQLLQLVSAAKNTVDRNGVEEFYLYYVTRGLYGELGASGYQSTYNTAMRSGGPFNSLCTIAGMPCPANITLAQATETLLNHADNQYSNNNTAGLPFPFWNAQTGFMFDTADGTSFEGLKPFGGSGLDLSGGPTKNTEAGGRPGQGSVYFDLENLGTEEHAPMYAASGGTFNPFDGTPDDALFGLVLYDPMFVWFTAAVTPVAGDCGNDPVPGTNGRGLVDQLTSSFLTTNSQRLCTQYDTTNQTNYKTKLDFAKLWYDLMIDSEQFLNITNGIDDAYTWTTGQSCSYALGEGRPSYTNKSESEILKEASKELYYIDEGESLGVIDRSLLIGDTKPPIGEYNYETNPLEHVGMIQILYPTLVPSEIVKKVKNCNRPGGPLNLTIEDAEEVLFQFKENFEESWSKGWDEENEGDVQFVGFYDDSGGVVGTTGRMLQEITTNGGTLMAISFAIIALFSILFLGSLDVISSKVLITMIGVTLVILSFFAGIGLAILFGIKINISIGWTLPFIIIGLGVDDMYIVSLSLKNSGGYKLDDFVLTMKEVLIPVTMTSLVNLCMFGIMTLSDIPSVYKTAQTAMICVALLYITILFSFPAYCWLDMNRQEAGRMDVFFCFKSKVAPSANVSSINKDEDQQKQDGDEMMEEARKEERSDKQDSTASDGGILYNQFYKPLMINDGPLRLMTKFVIWLVAIALLGISIYGCTQTEVGLGLEDFFPQSSQAGAWATHRTEHLASWSISMNWGKLDYTDPDVQLRVIKQFESVVSTSHVSEVDTDKLWIASLALWTTRQCSENFLKEDSSVLECGRDQKFNSKGSEATFDCSGGWKKNTLGLRNEIFNDMYDDKCEAYSGGVCRPTNQMHFMDLQELGAKGLFNPATDGDASWCPVFEGWTEEQLQFCVQKWREFTGGGGRLLVVPNTATENPDCEGDFYKNDTIFSPIPISFGPTMFGINLFSHADTMDMIAETRSFCDDDDKIHCWMSGIPFDYWEQYTYVESLLYEIVGSAVAIGFAVATIFLFGKFLLDKEHPVGKSFVGSVTCALIIALSCAISAVIVIGLSSLANVSLTAFSDMSFVLSIGFVVEYTVHITHRFLTAPMDLQRAKERVEYSMEFLFLPTFMSFVSSTIGVACLAFTDFRFNEIYFFRPLMIVMVVTYFFGCFFLPTFLSLLDFDFLRLGPRSHSAHGFDESALSRNSVNEKSEGSFVNEKVEPSPANESGEKQVSNVEASVVDDGNVGGKDEVEVVA